LPTGAISARSQHAGLRRRAGLKHQWQQCCAGSIPAPGTETEETDLLSVSFFCSCKTLVF